MTRPPSIEAPPKPWTIDDYEHLRIVVIALVRALGSVDAGNESMRKDLGPLLWAVLSALDRDPE